ncbi:hypothetical protein HAX54_014350 [Datura stramonium]|uniref:Uncharacterized protein n=1 Tax=Datura stramonium TaxID=4076 RepID=A0ABS8TN08_DATST|nr:hypothetical protein [Datura stramonium]
MEAIKSKSHSDIEILHSKGANSEVPTNTLDDFNERKAKGHVAPQSGSDSGDTVKAASIEEIHEEDDSEVSIRRTINQVLYDVKNLGKENLKNTKGDIVMETKIDTRHDDVSHMKKNSDTRVCQIVEQPKGSPIHKIDTPFGFDHHMPPNWPRLCHANS